MRSMLNWLFGQHHTSWCVWLIYGTIQSHSDRLSIQSTLYYCPVTTSGLSTCIPALSEAEGTISPRSELSSFLSFILSKCYLSPLCLLSPKMSRPKKISFSKLWKQCMTVRKTSNIQPCTVSKGKFLLSPPCIPSSRGQLGFLLGHGLWSQTTWVQLCHSPPWKTTGSSSTSSCFSFLICRMGTIMVLTSQG